LVASPTEIPRCEVILLSVKDDIVISLHCV
jgi:hypothetical protein